MTELPDSGVTWHKGPKELPEQELPVLVWFQGTFDVAWVRFNTVKGCTVWDFGEETRPVAEPAWWQPLPESPVEGLCPQPERGVVEEVITALRSRDQALVTLCADKLTERGHHHAANSLRKMLRGGELF